jgi:hypothetical protein
MQAQGEIWAGFGDTLVDTHERKENADDSRRLNESEKHAK